MWDGKLEAGELMAGRRCLPVALLALLLAGAGCASLAQRAPLVTPELAAVAASRGIDPQAAARGRDLYVGRCTKCHGAVAVASRTPEQWARILPRMAAETKLDAGQADDVAAYVEVAGRPPEIGR